LFLQFEEPTGADLADLASSTLEAVAAQQAAALAAEAKRRHEDLTFMTSIDIDGTGGVGLDTDQQPETDQQQQYWWEEQGAGLSAGQSLDAVLKRPMDRGQRGDPAKLRSVTTITSYTIAAIVSW
jgi:hypothetical protein